MRNVRPVLPVIHIPLSGYCRSNNGILYWMNANPHRMFTSGSPSSEKSLVIRNASKTNVFPLHTVIRLEARSNYTIVYSTLQRPILVAKVLSEYEDLLASYGFLRVHRSHLINRQHIQGLDGNGNVVLLDSSKVDVPRRKKRIVRGMIIT